MPKTRPPSPKHIPPCMTARARLKVKEKKKCFRQWRRSIDGKDYLLYAKARNQAKWECRRAEKEFEQIIASEAKINPKAFYKYARSKMKTRVRISNLTDEAGNLVTSDKDKLNFMNNLWTSQTRTSPTCPTSTKEFTFTICQNSTSRQKWLRRN